MIEVTIKKDGAFEYRAWVDACRSLGTDHGGVLVAGDERLVEIAVNAVLEWVAEQDRKKAKEGA